MDFSSDSDLIRQELATNIQELTNVANQLVQKLNFRSKICI